LRELQTESWISNDDSDRSEAHEVHDDSGSLVLKMHAGIGVGKLVVEILILVSNTMVIVILHVVEDGEVIVHVASSIKILRQEIEPDIVPVRWLDLIGGSISMFEVQWEWKLGDFGIKHGHLSLEEFIFTGIVIGILISHS
jgi:hypothetical protein